MLNIRGVAAKYVKFKIKSKSLVSIFLMHTTIFFVDGSLGALCHVSSKWTSTITSNSLCNTGVSLTISAGGELVFTVGQNYLN